MCFTVEQKMLRVKDEEMSQSSVRGRSLSRKGPGHYTEEDDDDGTFSESELELYEQYKAAGYRDLVSVCPSPVRIRSSCALMRLLVAGVAQRGRGRSARLTAEEGSEGEAREATREEDREEGGSIVCRRGMSTLMMSAMFSSAEVSLRP